MSRRKPMSEINVVPYIDVMLVLLVIFMATAPLLTQGFKSIFLKRRPRPLILRNRIPSWCLCVTTGHCS